MRLIKLSPQDPEMRTRDDVLDFFNRKLWLKSRAGKFGLTENKRRMTGIHKGALLVFSYRKECMFVARSSSGIITRKDPESPGYFVVELASIEAVSSTLEAYQRALKRHGVLDKELVHTQAWPRLSDACEEATLQYRGPLPGDERPVGGGKYNRTDTGHELYNFLPVASKLYGYFQPQMRKDETALERVESGAQGASLENVTVIFVARRPKGGQVIVGWYGGAKLFRSLGPKVAGRATHLPQYRCIANVRDSVLLPEKMRRLPIPHGPGGFGQANVCYPLERDGSRKSRRWMAQALSYLDSYDGENLLIEPEADASDSIVAELEAAGEGRPGQGFRTSAKDRAAIEKHGMVRAEKYFTAHGYDVKNVSDRRSYDLHCVKGDREIRVEVKATTTAGQAVFLTRREAELAASTEGEAALYVLHSVKLSSGVASAGRARVIWPWTLSWRDTTPVAYSYRVPPAS